MIRALYLDFGFFITLFICSLIVISVIFWLAGIAGLLANPDRKKSTDILTVIVCVFVPIYPIIWLFGDMLREFLTMRKHSKKTGQAKQVAG